MTAYYNEIDPFAAQWLRNLIVAGHIAPGDVDTRSIENVAPDDLRAYTQCHFFAGVGVWSYALRTAGWPDDAPVWTGSCPCQPFSAAGKGAGFADERHLWPAFFHLIEQCRPAVVFGEQVASKDVDPWIDLVQNDLEGVDYAVGAVAFPSAGVGAPHIRDRTYWVADATDIGQHRRRASKAGNGRDASRFESERLRAACGLADAAGIGWTQKRTDAGRQFTGDSEEGRTTGFEHGHGDCGLADARQDNDASEVKAANYEQPQTDRSANQPGRCGVSFDRPGPVNGFWRDADWLGCRDDKWRPVEPGTFPLADGAPARVGRLRAYGNAINAEAARAFVEAFIAGRPAG